MHELFKPRKNTSEETSSSDNDKNLSFFCFPASSLGNQKEGHNFQAICFYR